jgi:hypothetical protein
VGADHLADLIDSLGGKEAMKEAVENSKTAQAADLFDGEEDNNRQQQRMTDMVMHAASDGDFIRLSDYRRQNTSTRSVGGTNELFKII